jgi:hypothetical protein
MGSVFDLTHPAAVLTDRRKTGVLSIDGFQWTLVAFLLMSVEKKGLA